MCLNTSFVVNKKIEHLSPVQYVGGSVSSVRTRGAYGTVSLPSIAGSGTAAATYLDEYYLVGAYVFVARLGYLTIDLASRSGQGRGKRTL